MKKLIIFFLSILFIQNVFSQNTDIDSCAVTKENRPWAILIRYSNNLSFDSFEGANLSMQRTVGEKSAIRVGISISADDNEGSGTTELNTNNSESYSEGKHDNISFSINTKYLYELISNKNIKFYIGSGPFYSHYNSTSTSKQKYINADTLSGNVQEKREEDYYNYGLELITGIEWLAKPYLSLLAEYGTKFYYRNSASERISKNHNYSSESIQKGESDGFSIDSLPIRIGIAFKF